MGCGRFYKESDGLKIDVGAYCKGLEYACGIKAEYVGKPDPAYFLSAAAELKIPLEFCMMIGKEPLKKISFFISMKKTKNSLFISGDDVQNDCGAAQKAGLRALLVRTGKYRPDDEKRTDVTPDGVVDDLLEAVQTFLSSQNSVLWHIFPVQSKAPELK